MASTPITVPSDNQSDILASGSQINFGDIIPMIITKFIAVLEGAVIIALGFFLIRYVRNRLQKAESTHENQRNAINLLEKITSGFIIIIAVTLALKIIGLDMTLLVSVAILGLSYGLQDIIKNYVAGILILFKAPFKIGDIVKIRDFTGKVSKMDFQSTSLETFDGRHITIYNSDVMTQSIINYSHKKIRRMEMDIILGYNSNIPHAFQIFDKILGSHPGVIKNPQYSVVFKKFSETGPVFTLKFWVQKPCNILRIRTEIAALVGQAFDEKQIISPYVRGIEAENETTLETISEDRKKRIHDFYESPLFAQTIVPEAAIPGQPETALDTNEYDEPEA